MSNIQRPSLEELEAYLSKLEEDKAAAELELKYEASKKAETSPEPQAAEPAAKQDTPPCSDEIVDQPAQPAVVKAKRSPLAKIWGFVSTVLVIAVILLAIALVGVRLIGYTPYAVLSPSMTPSYYPGDLIYVKETPTESINEGDVITFVADASSTVVTHRVVEVDRDGRKFYTQGDANDTRDGNPVLYENVLGVVEFSIPKLGYVSSYVTSDTGKYVAIAGVFVLILLWILPELFRPEEKKVEEQTSAKD